LESNRGSFDVLGNVDYDIPGLENLKNLKSFTSVYINYKKFPVNLFSNISLESFTLALGEINEIPIEINNLIPQNIDQLTKLKRLSLTQGKISSIPSSLFNLKNLEFLNLRGNSVSTISSNISKLEKLTSLDFSFNNLANVPKIIGDLNNLKILGISGNLLTSLPKEYGKLTSLTTLNIRSNKSLLSIPQSICDLENTGTRISKDNITACTK